MTSKKIPKKRGKLSIDEERYIRENVSELSIEQIADAINRTAKPVERLSLRTILGSALLLNNKIIKPLSLNCTAKPSGTSS